MVLPSVDFRPEGCPLLGFHEFPGNCASGNLDRKRDARNLRGTKNGGGNRTWGKGKWRGQPLQARMVAGARRRRKSGPRMGPLKKEPV